MVKTVPFQVNFKKKEDFVNSSHEGSRLMPMVFTAFFILNMDKSGKEILP